MEGEGPAWVEFPGGAFGLRFSQDQPFDVTYVNELAEPTLIHAHGMTGVATPPYTLDGVPYVDAEPIAPGERVHYRYDLKAHNVGTHWIHSHYGFHHELGLAAPMVVDGPFPEGFPHKARLDRMSDAVMFLEDFCSFPKDGPDPNSGCLEPHKVFDALKADWQKEEPGFDFSECLEAARGEDTWDVGFKSHLANGRPASDPRTVLVPEGEAFIRIRIINAAEMTNYHVELGQLSGELVATDGQPCHPKREKSVWVGVAQRMDVVVKVPTAPGAYPIKAVAEGLVMDEHVRQSVLVLVVGGPSHIPAKGAYSPVPEAAPGMMLSKGELSLRAWTPLPEPTGATRHIVLNLTGNNGFRSINTHSWSIPPLNTVHYTPNPHPIRVRSGERICITFRNFNDDSHPFHLHGHVFQVTKIGDTEIHGAMRDTVLVGSGDCATLQICFQADNPGIWPLHCHMSYHLAAGMITSIEYDD